MSDDAPFIPARDHGRRSAVCGCEACDHWTDSALSGTCGDGPEGLPAALRCEGCGAERPARFTDRVDAGGRLDGCPVCDYHTLAIQKDFNARFGLAVVVVTFGALLFSGLSLPWMLAALVAVALLDWALLRLVVKRLLICYRCKAQYRGFPPGETCRPFDLATWEVHTPPTDG